MDSLDFSRVFIVAEIGVNHEGDPEIAAQLIKAAAEAGADAVKFQTFRIEHYISTAQPERRERTARFQLSAESLRDLAATATDAGVTFFSTPFDPADADLLEEIGVPCFKISSGDLTYRRLLSHVASKGKPIILSTGLGTEEEIQAAVDAILEVDPTLGARRALMLMHCVSAYPTPPEEACVANVGWLRERFGLPVGYSDHTLGTEACTLSVAAGARAIEKHFTYRKEDQAFHDHALSADPDDLRELVAGVRRAETYLGSDQRLRASSEEKMLDLMRRSVGAAVDIPAGEPVESAWLTGLRPAWGLSIDRLESVVGRRLRRDVPAGDLIKEEDLESA